MCVKWSVYLVGSCSTVCASEGLEIASVTIRRGLAKAGHEMP